MAEFRDSIEIDASPAEVFHYLTSAAGLNAWLGQDAQIEPVPGGQFAVAVAGYPVRGEYLQVDPPHRVVVSWGFAGNEDLPEGASEVEFRLIPVGMGTRVELAHTHLPSAEVAGHTYGWAHFLPRLAHVGSGGVPVEDDWVPLGREATSLKQEDQWRTH